MALLERKEEILKPKEIKKQKPSSRARIITIIYTQKRLHLKAFIRKIIYPNANILRIEKSTTTMSCKIMNIVTQ
jgi:hypothetical protein